MRFFYLFEKENSTRYLCYFFKGFILNQIENFYYYFIENLLRKFNKISCDNKFMCILAFDNFELYKSCFSMN